MRARKKPFQSWIRKSIEDIEKEAFNEGQEAGIAKVCDKLSELKSVYEKDLDAEPRVYERAIQLCVMPIGNSTERRWDWENLGNLIGQILTN